jgi:hypothetical protein
MHPVATILKIALLGMILSANGIFYFVRGRMKKAGVWVSVPAFGFDTWWGLWPSMRLLKNAMDLAQDPNTKMQCRRWLQSLYLAHGLGILAVATLLLLAICGMLGGR